MSAANLLGGHMPKRSETDKALPAFDLKAARESKGLTQIETAQLLSAAQSTIAKWEADGRVPKIYRDYWELYWKHAKPNKKKAA
jgi:DNA-binding XRE family transcriptional regulator